MHGVRGTDPRPRSGLRSRHGADDTDGAGANALLALVAPTCVISGFYDVGYSNPARSRLDVAYELLFVGAIAVLGALAGLRFISLLRRR
jgi:hypothetical protein